MSRARLVERERFALVCFEISHVSELLSGRQPVGRGFFPLRAIDAREAIFHPCGRDSRGIKRDSSGKTCDLELYVIN